MAEIVYNNKLSPIEIAKRKDPDGSAGQIAELLELENEFLPRIYSEQANEARTDQSLIRVKLPTISPRRIYEGVDQNYSRVLPHVEPIMLLEDILEVDEQVLDPEASPSAAMQQEVTAHTQAMSHALMNQIFYGNMGNVGEIDGLSTRFNDPTNQENVWDMGHTTNGECSSLWMFETGPQLMGLIFPRNHPSAGIEAEDKGHGKLYDGNNKPFYGYTYRLKVMAGLKVVDPDSIQRIGAIATTGVLKNMQDDAINPHHFLVDALTQLPRRGRMGTAFMAANRWMLAQFNKWAMDKTNGFYYAANISGQAVTMFQELPIVLVESLSGTEDAI